MLSRIADSLFWMNRYMERSDCFVRLIRTNYILSFDNTAHTDFSWKDVITLLTFAPEEIATEQGSEISSALRYLFTDTKNPNSIKILITKARENARGVQDNITKEVWEQVNQVYHIINDPELPDKITGPRALETIDLIDQNNTLYYGVTDSSMPRGQGWNFMNLGKYIERCLLTIDTALVHFKKIDHHSGQTQDILFWRNLLLSLSGYELYLKTYTRGKHTMNVIDHILFNEDFPRSILYCLKRIKRYLQKVAADNKIEGSDNLLRKFGRISSHVEFSDTNMIFELSLPQYLHTLRKDIIDFSNDLSRIYFSYA